MSSELACLQVVRLKGRTTPDAVAAASGLSEQDVTAQLDALVGAEHCVEASGRYRLTKPGRERLTELLAAERESVDNAALTELYGRFDEHNSAFKQIVTDWQMHDEQTPNDHTDAAYDGAVIERLAELHRGLRPLLAEMVGQADRLSPYPARLDTALEKVQAGDHTWVAKPLLDSYHTVWFELHEDLIGLCGLNRADEAAAGRAQ